MWEVSVSSSLSPLSFITPRHSAFFLPQLVDLPETTKVKTTQVAHSRGKRCGDIELAAYITDVTGPIKLVMDLHMVTPKENSKKKIVRFRRCRTPTPLCTYISPSSRFIRYNKTTWRKGRAQKSEHQFLCLPWHWWARCRAFSANLFRKWRVGLLSPFCFWNQLVKWCRGIFHDHKLRLDSYFWFLINTSYPQ